MYKERFLPYGLFFFFRVVFGRKTVGTHYCAYIFDYDWGLGSGSGYANFACLYYMFKWVFFFSRGTGAETVLALGAERAKAPGAPATGDMVVLTSTISADRIRPQLGAEIAVIAGNGDSEILFPVGRTRCAATRHTHTHVCE